MDGGQITAIVIVAIVMVASIIRAGVKSSYYHLRNARPDSQTQVENQHLRSEVQELKERIKVLERITVDKENSLARQIDDLRDR
jgi:hypothetical protein